MNRKFSYSYLIDKEHKSKLWRGGKEINKLVSYIQASHCEIVARDHHPYIKVYGVWKQINKNINEYRNGEKTPYY
jgi:hypothetical protein